MDDHLWALSAQYPKIGGRFASGVALLWPTRAALPDHTLFGPLLDNAIGVDFINMAGDIDVSEDLAMLKRDGVNRGGVRLPGMGNHKVTSIR